MAKSALAIVGAGAVGRLHAKRALVSDDWSLVAIVDTSESALAFAKSAGVPCFEHHMCMLDKVRPRGVIVATPNQSHSLIGQDCLKWGAAVLVEKPIADTLQNARLLCDVAKTTGSPLIVGHHRRYSSITQKAKHIIESGLLGSIAAISCIATWLKPDSYYEVGWRVRRGGGPVMINVIHDIDLLRYLFGDIETAQAFASNIIRGLQVEDTAAAVFRFRNGALATAVASDTTAAPWNWDLAAGEDEQFPRYEVNSIFVTGTRGSLALPRLEFWGYRGASGWHNTLSTERLKVRANDPYTEQLRHFHAVVENLESPVCSGADGLRTLDVTLGLLESAATSGLVRFEPS